MDDVCANLFDRFTTFLDNDVSPKKATISKTGSEKNVSPLENDDVEIKNEMETSEIFIESGSKGGKNKSTDVGATCKAETGAVIEFQLEGEEDLKKDELFVEDQPSTPRMEPRSSDITDTPSLPLASGVFNRVDEISHRAIPKFTNLLSQASTIEPLFPLGDNVFGDQLISSPAFGVFTPISAVKQFDSSFDTNALNDVNPLPIADASRNVVDDAVPIQKPLSRKARITRMQKKIRHLWAAKIYLQVSCGLEPEANLRVNDVLKIALDTIRKLEIEEEESRNEMIKLVEEQANYFDRMAYYKNVYS